MSQPEVTPGIAELVSVLDLTGVAASALVGRVAGSRSTVPAGSGRRR